MRDPILVSVTLEVTVELTLEANALDRTQTEEWRHQMYDFTLEQAAGHLAWQVGVLERSISDVDGWADLPDSAAEAAITSRTVLDYLVSRDAP